MHLIRLLLSGITILREGFVPVRVEDHRSVLLSIKYEQMSWEAVNEWRLRLHEEFDRAFTQTQLPDRPDYEAANAFLLKARRSQIESDSGEVTMFDREIHNPLNSILQNQAYPLVFATLSGSHIDGFPSPDSDYDLGGASVVDRGGD